MIDEGIYWGKPIKAVSSTSKAGDGMLVVDFEVTHYEDKKQHDWVPMRPVERRIYLSFSGGAFEITQKKLQALGFDGNVDSPGFAVSEGVKMVCTHGENKGKATENWDILTERPQVEKAGAEVLRRMRAMWNNAKRPAGKPASPPPAPTSSPPADELTNADLGLPEPTTTMNADGDLVAKEAAAPTGDKIPF